MLAAKAEMCIHVTQQREENVIGCETTLEKSEGGWVAEFAAVCNGC
jgi:hypothetical protein